MSESTMTPSGSLSTLKLAELQTMARGMGLTGISAMRKADLVAAIGGAGRSTPRASATASAPAAPAAREPQRSERTAPETAPAAAQAEPAERGERTDSGDERHGTRRSRRGGRRAGAPAGAPAPVEREQSRETENRPVATDPAPREASVRESGERTDARRESRDMRDGRDAEQREPESREQRGQSDRREQRRDANPPREARQQDRREGGQQDRRDSAPQDRRDGGQQDRRDSSRGFDDDDAYGRRRNRRQRGRDRTKRPMGRDGMGGALEEAPEISEDDVLVPVAGILDVLDSYAFVRTSGYLPGPNDVYVPLGMVKRFGLRKGDAITGSVRAMRDGEQLPARQKFNALVALDTVNAASPEESRNRVEFNSLTPLYPQERLRLETEQNKLTTRVIDLVSPIGKGQRGLIVSPPKAGKTMIMQAIANAITANNPEVHLMVVLVDERPEEVTDFQRSVAGEVIASTFDRPATDHTMVAELAIERAKRLVELGHDVVVLLDGITRLGRAYNLAAPASGRILSGGVDSSALYPPKKFFGAARNIENGGSLTILATALVETGSKMDEVIFEEFKGTGNMELRLSRHLADRRTFPAVDVNASGTRREEILMAPEELKIMWKLRRVLSALDQQQNIELLIDRLKKTRNNYEFLVQVQQTSSAKLDDED